MIVKAPVGAMAGPTLVGPAVCGEVPVRSTVMQSPAAAAFEMRLVEILAVAQLANRAAHPLLGPVHQ